MQYRLASHYRYKKKWKAEFEAHHSDLSLPKSKLTLEARKKTLVAKIYRFLQCEKVLH